MQIEIINVSAPQTPAGKKYKFIEVAYKKEGAVEGKKLMDFANPVVFKEVQNFSQGDVVDVKTVKNEKGYWDWVGLTLLGDVGNVVGTPAVENLSPRAATTTAKPVSNYETKEERAIRQRLIVRQSSLSNALSFLDGKKADEKDVIAMAERFTDWVFQEKVAKLAVVKDFAEDFAGDEDLVL